MEGRWTLSARLLEVEIEHRVGTLALDVNFALTKPWTVLFGPSGSGKTTVMRAIAGFVRPDAGWIVRGESVLVNREAGIWVPAHARPVRTAGQVARLFPQMTVMENVLYGVGAKADGVVDEVMGLFRLRELAGRMPRALSGGESQRVSVARAVVSAVTLGGPALLLLDEPFGGLDLKLRDELVVELRDWLGRWKVPVLSVTHDVGEAFLLGAEVIKIAEGRVVQHGPVEVVLAEERRRLVERLRG
jgi:molybdate transport system ATP-binding protein